MSLIEKEPYLMLLFFSHSLITGNATEQIGREWTRTVNIARRRMCHLHNEPSDNENNAM